MGMLLALLCLCISVGRNTAHLLREKSLKLHLDIVSGVTSSDKATLTHHSTTRTMLKGEDPSGNPTAAGVAAHTLPLWPRSHPRARLLSGAGAVNKDAIMFVKEIIFRATAPDICQRRRRAISKLKNPKPKKGEAAQARLGNWDFTSTPLTDEELARNGRVKSRDPGEQNETTAERTGVGVEEQPTEALVLPSLSCYMFFASSVAPLRKELITERHLVPPPDVNAGSLYPGGQRRWSTPIRTFLPLATQVAASQAASTSNVRTRPKFTIHLEVTNDYAWRHPNCSLNIVIFINGEHAKGPPSMKLWFARPTPRYKLAMPSYFLSPRPPPLVAKQKDERSRSKSTVSPINETTPLIHPTRNGNGTHYYMDGTRTVVCVQPATNCNTNGAVDASHQMIDEEARFYRPEKFPHTTRFENLSWLLTTDGHLSLALPSPESPITIADLASGLGYSASREALQPAETVDDAGSGGARKG
ncbi:hypothetical protein DL768_011565 [Monosporascus sp. mg162]|nr:hypothetical protein DL768_011565 [Monosporascus sp. mg162]